MSRVVFFLIGCLLAFTAFAKLWMLLTDPFADIHSPYPLAILWFVTMLEIAIIWYLVVGKRSFGKTLVCAVLLSCFLVLSTFNWLTGIETCGCAGQVDISPAVSVSVNAAILVLLLVFCIDRQYKHQPFVESKLPWSRNDFFAVVGVFGGLMFASIFLSSIANQRFVGSRNIVAKPIPSLHPVFGEKTEIPVCLVNNTNHAVQLTGGGKSCTCLTISNVFGRFLQPGENWLTIQFVPKQPGVIRQRLYFYVDDPICSFVFVELTGTTFGDVL